MSLHCSGWLSPHYHLQRMPCRWYSWQTFCCLDTPARVAAAVVGCKAKAFVRVGCIPNHHFLVVCLPRVLTCLLQQTEESCCHWLTTSYDECVKKPVGISSSGVLPDQLHGAQHGWSRPKRLGWPCSYTASCELVKSRLPNGSPAHRLAQESSSTGGPGQPTGTIHKQTSGHKIQNGGPYLTRQRETAEKMWRVATGAANSWFRPGARLPKRVFPPKKAFWKCEKCYPQDTVHTFYLDYDHEAEKIWKGWMDHQI